MALKLDFSGLGDGNTERTEPQPVEAKADNPEGGQLIEKQCWELLAAFFPRIDTGNDAWAEFWAASEPAYEANENDAAAVELLFSTADYLEALAKYRDRKDERQWIK